LGWTDRPLTADVARQLIKWFKTDAAPKYQATFMGGVRDSWRTMAAPWDSVFRSIDVISPWFVGSFSGLSGADNNKKNNLAPDIAEAKRIGKDYLPVVWPGFSWANMHHGTTPQNQIPRLGGTFYWRQMYNCITAGATALYVAMFDEVDEATAILKASPTKATAPADGYTLTLDADGNSLPSDWYLKLTGYARKMLNKQIPLSSTIPTVGTIQEPLPRSASAPRERMSVCGGVVTLSGLRKGKAEVVFYRLTGQLEKAFTIITTSSGNGTTHVPIGVHSGAYLVQLKMDGKIVVSKVLYSL
jgi:hypothetical protein